MMWPILCRVSPTALARLFQDRRIWYHLAFSLVVNWIIAPLVMLALAWAFLPDRAELRTGLILVGIARCIAMVSSPGLHLLENGIGVIKRCASSASVSTD